MLILSSDNNVIVDVGTNDYLFSLYSTIIVRAKTDLSEAIDAVHFLENGKCSSNNCIEVGKQFKIIREKLSKIDVNLFVYDYKHPEKVAPWEGSISSDVHNCAELFMTVDGKNLIEEIIAVLEYAGKTGVDVIIFEE